MSRIVTVLVKPNSKKGPLVELGAGSEASGPHRSGAGSEASGPHRSGDDGVLTVFVREPATEGKANKAVGQLLAKHFGVPKSTVELVGGATSRHKRFRIG